MIRFEHSKRGTMIEANGDLVTLCAEVALLTKLLYEQLERDDVKTEFREYIQRIMESGSPTWEEVNFPTQLFVRSNLKLS